MAEAPPPLNPLQEMGVEFVGSFPDPLVRLEPPLPEIALIGRSNVGKSSLLNALVGRPGLARVSGTPGKTTLLNAFRLPAFYLVDLPGYGFARAGKAARAGYRRLVTRYLGERPSLAGDPRRGTRTSRSALDASPARSSAAAAAAAAAAAGSQSVPPGLAPTSSRPHRPASPRSRSSAPRSEVAPLS